MNSTQRKQQQAAALRKANRLLSKFTVANTVNWNDESYATLLAKQLHQKVDAEGKSRNIFSSLKNCQNSFSYLFDEPIVDGVRVWSFDVSRGIHPGWLMITGADHVNGKFKLLDEVNPVYISPHAAVRIYQRLRTNSSSDFKSLVQGLLALGDPQDVDNGTQFEVSLPSGTAYAVKNFFALDAEQLPGIGKHYWAVKTFIRT